MSEVRWTPPKGLSWSVMRTPTFSTEIQPSLAGREVRIQNFQNPLWEMTCTFEYLLNDPRYADETGFTPLEQIMGFYLARGGQFDDFLLNLTDLTQRQEDSVYSGQPIGTGDGTTTAFQLVRNLGGFMEAVQNPSNQSATIYVNGVAKTPTTDYTITNGLVTFTAAPANGALITADFVMLYRVRFDVGTSRQGTREGVEFENFQFHLYQCRELQLISVRK